MRAANKSDQTCRTYMEAGAQFDEFLEAIGTVRSVDQVRRSHVEDWLISMQRRELSAATVNNRYRALQQFFNWCLEEEEVVHSPMERTKAPIVPERPVPVVDEEALRLLLKSLAGRSFMDRRDNAIVRLFLDTGLRRSELASIRVSDVELDERLVDSHG